MQEKFGAEAKKASKFYNQEEGNSSSQQSPFIAAGASPCTFFRILLLPLHVDGTFPCKTATYAGGPGDCGMTICIKAATGEFCQEGRKSVQKMSD